MTTLTLIDNYDSFTYNLVQFFGDLGVQTRVHRNNKITVDEAVKLVAKSYDRENMPQGTLSFLQIQLVLFLG